MELVTKLTPNQKVLVLAMQANGKNKYLVRELCELTKIQKTHIREHLRELEELGLVTLLKEKNRLEVLL